MGTPFYRRIFAPDSGVLQAIRVLDMGQNDWNHLLRYVSGSSFSEYSEDGAVAPLPPIYQIMERRKEVSTFLDFRIGETQVSTHFPDRDRLQIDLRPEDVSSCERADSILEFMAEIACLLKKRVLLTYETARGTDEELQTAALCVVNPEPYPINFIPIEP